MYFQTIRIIKHIAETEEGFVKLFSKKLGCDDDVEEGEEVLSSPTTENQSLQEVPEDDGSPAIQNIRHLYKVLIFASIF